ncbi:hypothetical protein TIFTF001_039243 [Ficus carica]|uniref:Uncharacterized protein n=1 Tax=Ficus carica TaxID=3494 RepID=A0AA88EE64_FICCA|nr:hypothetical protein TIFTF001_039243 [Ficus carica]
MRGSNFVWTKENAELEGQKVSGRGKQCGPVGTGKGLVEDSISGGLVKCAAARWSKGKYGSFCLRIASIQEELGELYSGELTVAGWNLIRGLEMQLDQLLSLRNTIDNSRLEVIG